MSDSGDFCYLLITFVNSLNPDQARQNVGSDLNLNCLTLMVFRQDFFEKVEVSFFWGGGGGHQHCDDENVCKITQHAKSKVEAETQLCKCMNAIFILPNSDVPNTVICTTCAQRMLVRIRCQKEITSTNCTHLKRYEPRHEISNKVVCATSKGSDQPAHTRSLIRAIASRLNIL